ncbi:2-isopropylmalate synthase [Rhodococcus spelaei]|uniref:2-isopropylmalate synthase n=1 Tax=Rhodococcus spelaei TaxID=2546320 RepID=A0A541BQK7_9NOCA|nr:alpha-isopropylmalate synthase regulatory domain-containing protein [Rhodococcus spelaei]TQF74575.1 2-isopropylmalate synthase [Rhodococcus spelaei]
MNTLQAFTSSTPADPFTLRYGTPLPREMRADCAGMNWRTFLATYSPTNGPVRFGRWSVTPVGAGNSEFKATLGIGNTIRQATTVAGGPVSALTTMLYEAGFQLEILSFHQIRVADGRTATFLLCEHDGRRHWALGMGSTATESSIEAMIAGANLLHG